MIVSALGLVSSLSQGPAASKKFKDILLLLGKYKAQGALWPKSFPGVRPCLGMPALPKRSTEPTVMGHPRRGAPGTEHSSHSVVSIPNSDQSYITEPLILGIKKLKAGGATDLSKVTDVLET